MGRLVGHNTDADAVIAGKSDKQIRGEQFLDLEKFSAVDGMKNDLLHIVGGVGILRDDRIEVLGDTSRRIVAGLDRCRLEVVLGQIGNHLFDIVDGIDTRGGGVIGDTATRRVHRRPAEFFNGDILMGHRFDNLGAGQEHVGIILHHDYEIGQGRRIDCSTGTRTEDCRDLRHHPRGHDIAQENLGIPGQTLDALLDPGAAGVVEADDRCAVFHRKVHDLADLFSEGFGQGATENGEILGKDIDDPPIDSTVAGDHTVTGKNRLVHAEITAAVRLEHIEFFKRTRIEQQFDPLPGGHLPLAVQFVDLVLTSAQASLLPESDKVIQPILRIHILSLA